MFLWRNKENIITFFVKESALSRAMRAMGSYHVQIFRVTKVTQIIWSPGHFEVTIP